MHVKNWYPEKRYEKQARLGYRGLFLILLPGVNNGSSIFLVTPEVLQQNDPLGKVDYKGDRVCD